jgi:type II secretion system protein C
MEIVPSPHHASLKRLVPVLLLWGVGLAAIGLHRPVRLRTPEPGVCRHHPVFTVRRAVNEAIWGDPSRLVAGVRIVPSMREGRPNGFKIYAVRPSSVLALLGFHNGDLILAVNGRNVSSPDAALETFSSLRSANRIVCEIERGGRRMLIVVDISHEAR